MSRVLRRWRSTIAVFLVILLIVWRTPRSQPGNGRDLALTRPSSFNQSRDIEARLSVVVVCDIGLLLALERAIPLSEIAEVIFSCGEDDLNAFKSFWMSMEANFPRPIRIVESVSHYYSELSLLLAGSHAIHTNVLILDSESALESNSGTWINEALATITHSSLPIGPCGFDVLSTGQVHAASAPGRIHPVTFLRPPFIIDRRLLFDAINGMSIDKPPWIALGLRLAESPMRMQGGLRVSSSHQSCVDNLLHVDALSSNKHVEFVVYMVLFSGSSLLMDFQDTYCQLASLGKVTAVILLDEIEQPPQEEGFIARHCYIRYDYVVSSSNVSVAGIINRTAPDVVLYTLHEGLSIKDLEIPSTTTLVPLHQRDLRHTEWMSTLSMEQWKSWNAMRLDISVITNTRPHSFSRLLHSLNSALYFGNTDIDLTINMEQTADYETRQIAQHFTWNHGRLHVRHRVILGGLIPAIVESWYPTTNHSFGLILEDDIEVSPLYFAWIKMNILRYRYGAPSVRRPYLYGISLYQPKTVELRPEGRRPWSAQELFCDLPFPYTPYLAATPCSWGAVYFPEHWREFHDYIIRRLSAAFTPLDTLIVPKVRSNFWKKSWKRFFIEFAWLRGYTMLYPNYDDFLAFATNHVEIGSHVSDASAKARKRALFAVPLMSLNNSMSSFLQLPAGELPDLDEVPVVDLHGHLSSMFTLQTQGEAGRQELCQSELLPNSYDASELLC